MDGEDAQFGKRKKSGANDPFVGESRRATGVDTFDRPGKGARGICS